MGWNNSVVTSNGIALLNESLAGHTLTITGAVGGAGTLDPTELMSTADVTERKQTLKLLGIEDCDVGKKVKIQIGNTGITEKYILHQVGVFAKLNYQEEESLLFIMQDERGVEIPTAEENPDFLFEMYAIIAISNDANIKCNLSTSAVVSVGLLMEGLNAVGGIKIDMEFSILPEEWVEDPEPKNGYALYCNLQNEKITDEMVPMVTLDEDCLYTAAKSGLCSTATTKSGYLRLKCMEKPEDRVYGVCNFMTKSGNVDFTVQMTGNSVATDEEVKEVIDEVFGEATDDSGSEDTEQTDEIATDEEVAEVVKDIFGT